MYRKERFRLRFFGMAPDVADRLRAALPGSESPPALPGRRRREEVLLFDLQVGIDFSRLFRVLDTLSLGPRDYEVLASVVTASDNGGIELPDYILDLIRCTRCGVGFSFVNIGPDDDDEDEDEVSSLNSRPDDSPVP